jgi:hypothetical protein
LTAASCLAAGTEWLLILSPNDLWFLFRLSLHKLWTSWKLCLLFIVIEPKCLSVSYAMWTCCWL